MEGERTGFLFPSKRLCVFMKRKRKKEKPGVEQRERERECPLEKKKIKYLPARTTACLQSRATRPPSGDHTAYFAPGVVSCFL